MKKIKILFVCAVLIIIGIPILKFNFVPESISAIDNRYLAELPHLTGGVDYTEAWNNYINDRIGLRDRAIDAYTQINDRLFGLMIHPSYEYGKEGYVFFKRKSPAEDYEFLDAYVSFLEQIQTYCKERNVPFLYVVDPGKESIYTEYLPEGYHYSAQRLQYFMSKLDEHQINYIDNVALLKEKAKQEQIFNVKYDAGHWNDLGAFYGINHIIEGIQRYFPDVPLNREEDFDISTEIATSLPVSKFPIEEEVPKFTLKSSITDGFVQMKNNYQTLRLDETYNGFQFNVNRLAKNNVRALYLQGSYLNSRNAMLWPSLHESINVHSYQNAIDFDYYYNIFQPDIVIFEGAEYATSALYFEKERMEKKIFNPPIERVDAKTSNAEVSTEVNASITTVTVASIKKTYAYIKINEKVYDLLWDEFNQCYYADIDTKDHIGEIQVYVVD